DIEAVVELALPDDLVAVRIVAPFARAQHFPDLGVRELVEEAKLAELVELRLLVDAIRLRAQRLIDPRKRAGELEARLEAMLGLFAEGRRDDVLDLLGDLGPERMERRRRRVDDLVQQPAQAIRTKRPIAGQEL